MTYSVCQKSVVNFIPMDPIKLPLAPPLQDKDGELVMDTARAFAEGTRHIWDTPEEDEAWAHLATDAPPASVSSPESPEEEAK